MIHLKKILVFILVVIWLAAIALIDLADRTIVYYKHTSEKEWKEFFLYETDFEVRQAFERHFKDVKYRFPRVPVKEVVLYRNIPILSRLTGKRVEKKLFLDFVNNPENFDWGETTWEIEESEYIVRFYDFNNNVRGKMWLCLKDCGMTESIPFSPTMKFGGLSSSGKKKLSKIIEETYN